VNIVFTCGDFTTEDRMQEAVRDVKARNTVITYTTIKEVFVRNEAEPPDFDVWSDYYIKHVWGWGKQ
jgi:hypothetical protein